jgi:hypothetical protein
MKLEKIIFATDDNPEYSGFWKINSEICKKKLGITPVLFKIGETNLQQDTNIINKTIFLQK